MSLAVPRKKKSVWLTTEWLARRDAFIATLNPDALYRIKDIATSLDLFEGTLISHIHQHSSTELKGGQGGSLPGWELVKILEEFRLIRVPSAGVSAHEKSKGQMALRDKAPVWDPGPEAQEPWEHLVEYLEQLPSDMARQLAFKLAAKFSRVGG